MTPFDIKRLSGRLDLLAAWVTLVSIERSGGRDTSTEVQDELRHIAEWLRLNPDVEARLEVYLDEQEDTSPH